MIWRLEVAVYEVLQAGMGSTCLGVGGRCHSVKGCYQYRKATERWRAAGQLGENGPTAAELGLR